jgi:hypothetical protein
MIAQCYLYEQGGEKKVSMNGIVCLDDIQVTPCNWSLTEKNIQRREYYMRNDIHFGENVSDEAKDDSSASFNLNGSRSKGNYFSLCSSISSSRQRRAGQQFRWWKYFFEPDKK